ncbi:MAG: hypothetical protein IPK03_03090 [Bacteroidetes bacterium]|nr:hypothetical protein [Bacteroidota bacterium]
MKNLGIVAIMILLIADLSAQQEKVRFEKNKIYLGNNQIKRKEYKALIKNNEEAMSHLRHQATAYAFGYPFAIIGGFSLGLWQQGYYLIKILSLKRCMVPCWEEASSFAATSFIL